MAQMEIKTSTTGYRLEIHISGLRKNWRETKAQAFEVAAACIRDSGDVAGRPVYHGSIYVDMLDDTLALVVFEHGSEEFEAEKAEKIAEVNVMEFERKRAGLTKTF